jgi:hypothetical protein
VHVESIDTQVVSGEIDGLEYLPQRQMLAVAEEHYLVWRLLHLRLDEAQQMLLIHTCRVVNMRVYLSDVVEVSMRDLFAVGRFLVFIQQVVQVELALQVLKSPESEALARTIGRDIQDGVQVDIVVSHSRDCYNGRLGLLRLRIFVHLINTIFV